MRLFLSVCASLGAVLVMALGQPAASDKLPDFSDVISVRMPQGYRYAGGHGVFNRFTYHYLPEKADMEHWQEKVTLEGHGHDHGLLADAGKQYFEDVAGKCRVSSVTKMDAVVTLSGRSRDVKHYCIVTQAGAMPLRPTHEFGLYRMIATSSGTYVFHYKWRGTGQAALDVFEKDPDAFWARAKAMLDHFNVCDLARSTTCWVDRDVVGRDSQRETDDSLRCQHDPDVACNPTAILIFRAKNPDAVIEGVPRGTGLLQMDRQDLTSARLALSLLRVVKKTLDGGAPEFALVVKPSANPDHAVTFRERAIIAAFFNLMGETAVQEDIAESYGSLMLNFHPGKGPVS